jgi:hypothetical protein
MASHTTAALLSALDEAASLLRQSDHKKWASWLEQDRRRIADDDLFGVEHLLQAFGGMGSLNDLVLVEPDKDAKLRALCSRIYDQASALRKVRNRA